MWTRRGHPERRPLLGCRPGRQILRVGGRSPRERKRKKMELLPVSLSAPSILELAGMLAASPPTIKIPRDSATLTFTLSCSQLMFSDVKFIWFHSCRATAEMLAGGEQRHLQHNQNHLQPCQSSEESLTLSSSRGQSGSAQAETEFSFTLISLDLDFLKRS